MERDITFVIKCVRKHWLISASLHIMSLQRMTITERAAMSTLHNDEREVKEFTEHRTSCDCQSDAFAIPTEEEVKVSHSHIVKSSYRQWQHVITNSARHLYLFRHSTAAVALSCDGKSNESFAAAAAALR